MSKFGPILVVLVAILSIGYMGFAGVATFGGPNWGAIAGSMTDYQFIRNPGPEPTWSAISRSDDNLKTSAVLPEVIVSALDHKQAELKTTLDELNADQPKVQQNLDDINRRIEVDKPALDAHLADQAQLLLELGEQAANLSRQVVQKTQEGSAIEKVVSDRRSDVFRQQNQLEVLRADQARIEQITRQMTDLIEQIDTDLDKARRREKQLRQRLGEDY